MYVLNANAIMLYVIVCVYLLSRLKGRCLILSSYRSSKPGREWPYPNLVAV